MNYKEILEGVVNIINTTEKSDIGFANICAYIGENCPDLAESENERIRKDIIIYLQYSMAFDKSFLDKKYNWSQKDCSKWIAWLEKQGEHTNFLSKIQIGDKVTRNEAGVLVNISQLNRVAKPAKRQGEQNNNEDVDILQRFSFYSYKDEPNVLYLSSVFVNEEYRNRGIGTKILEVTDEVAKSLNCHTIRLKTKKDSNAERLYRTHGYNSLTAEDSDEIWLEKQCEQKHTDKVEPKFKKE